ncbi:hypothetical protein RQP46_006230 [Phenoliferia psychrophenolica]
MPELSAGHRGGDIPFSHLDAFDSDRGWRDSWIEEVKRDFLPQKMTTYDEEDRSTNIKEGFNPRGTAPPSDQLLCLDTTLFLSFPPKPQAYPDLSVGESHPSDREGDAWRHAGQHLHFTPEVEAIADQYLLKMFEGNVPAGLITVHIRRKDFKSTYHFTDLEQYIVGVERVRHRIQARIDDPDSWHGPGKDKAKFPPGVAAADYQVVFTSDEAAGTPFMEEVAKLGWRNIDHVGMRTRETLGPWWPTALDQALLARGLGATDDDVLSAALRALRAFFFAF